VSATGGRVLYLVPRIQQRLGARAAIRAGVQCPVASALPGDQRERANLQTSVVLIP
jgi:hypothetical protein